MKSRWILVGLSFCSLATSIAKESAAPQSDFRRYFWGARKAYEDRRFKDAERQFRIYHQKGSPTDRLLKLAGCDPTWEVAVFAKALKESHECLAQQASSPFWKNVEQAKVDIMRALQSQDLATLIPYVSCAPTDLISQSTTCGTHSYRTAADLNRVLAVVHQSPDILVAAGWREFPSKPNDLQHVRWVLYPISDRWKPCGMAGSPLISLREDPPGQIRIAGFAASCLGPEREIP